MAVTRAVVAGAGLAGLAAAVELERAGVEVQLLERTRLLGGKATSFTIGGVEVDSGQHVHLGCCTEFVDFVGDVGTGADLVVQDRFDVVVVEAGRPPARLRAASLPAPLHLAAAFARYRPLPAAARAAVPRALLAATRAHPRPGETAAAWLRRHGQGPRAMRALWEPFLVPALNAPLDECDAGAAVFVIRTAFLASADAACIGWSRVPLARIAEAAASRCHSVRLRTAVTGLVHGGGVARGVRTAAGEVVAADAVVLAMPPDRLLRVLGETSDAAPSLRAFRPAPIVDVHLWYDGATLGIPFVAVIGSPVQWVFEKAPGYLCCSLSAAAEHVRSPESELVELCDRELRRALPQLAGATLTRSAATRDPQATFVPAPGLRRPGTATTLANLVVAGAWTDTGWPATMESAVRSGRSAARALLAGRGEERAVA